MQLNSTGKSLRERRGLREKLHLSWTPRTVLGKLSPKTSSQKSPISVIRSDGSLDTPVVDGEHLLDELNRLQLLFPIAVKQPKEYVKKLSALRNEVMKTHEAAEACRILFDMGRALERDGKHEGRQDDAADTYKLAMAQQPQDIKVIFRTGNALYRAGRYEEAVITYRAAIEADESTTGPSSLPYVAETPNTEAETPRFEGMKAPTAPLLARVYVNLGVALEAQDKLEEASKAYRGAIQKHREYPAAHKLLGGVSIALGEMKQAEGALCCAVDLQPVFPEAWADLGTARRWLMDPQGAISALKRALEQSPDQVVALWNLALAQRDCELFTDAMATLTRVLHGQPSLWAAHVHHGICNILQQQGSASHPEGGGSSSGSGGARAALSDLQAAAIKAPNGNEDVSSLLLRLLNLPEAVNHAGASSSDDDDASAGDDDNSAWRVQSRLLFNTQNRSKDLEPSDLPLPSNVTEGLLLLGKVWSRRLQRSSDKKTSIGPMGRALMARLESPTSASSLTPTLTTSQDPGTSAVPSTSTLATLPEGSKVVKTSSGGYQVVVDTNHMNDLSPPLHLSACSPIAEHPTSVPASPGESTNSEEDPNSSEQSREQSPSQGQRPRSRSSGSANPFREVTNSQGGGSLKSQSGYSKVARVLRESLHWGERKRVTNQGAHYTGLSMEDGKENASDGKDGEEEAAGCRERAVSDSIAFLHQAGHKMFGLCDLGGGNLKDSEVNQRIVGIGMSEDQMKEMKREKKDAGGLTKVACYIPNYLLAGSGDVSKQNGESGDDKCQTDSSSEDEDDESAGLLDTGKKQKKGTKTGGNTRVASQETSALNPLAFDEDGNDGMMMMNPGVITPVESDSEGDAVDEGGAPLLTEGPRGDIRLSPMLQDKIRSPRGCEARSSDADSMAEDEGASTSASTNLTSMLATAMPSEGPEGVRDTAGDADEAEEEEEQFFELDIVQALKAVSMRQQEEDEEADEEE
mmetsp:Transcript_4675/g.5418  ORF Transcript_4675/g.5418 Transcript_4675/m.5418 type:complete len:975 (+) Transcript_4675:256-3180(+)|eukprot:CAMPEP_0197850330 /NCGR_PEP_ID=MMETSP1438-20131217/15067_1 /TAXON_ID=1461541 /ORGANISM="Pterosperma sp., Strain CCMP1384" /LENGTH=974 /DNA_ID=CAMNT_0043463447 /DNA_START=238 /DNA_END=3162 /DNA_ORIENTATION=+